MDRELLEQYLNEGKTTREISYLIGKSRSTVLYWINKYGLTDKMKYAKPAYKNSKMFNKIDTPEKAYIIGYALADGYISDRIVEFGCCIADKELLQFISEYIGANYHEDMTYKPESRIFPHAEISIGNRDIVTDFNKHCSSKEEKHCPIISKSLERYLVQGFFDGDGCITWGRRKDRNRIWQKISFTSSLKVLEGIQQILLKQCDISTTIRPKGKEKCFVLSFANKKNVLKFLNYIYPDDSFIILKRKYEKATALRLELGENGERPTTPCEADGSIELTERVETNG